MIGGKTMGSIFISYRREDTQGQAGRLHDDLAARFGKDAVFMDVTNIEPGRDFREAIEQNVQQCDVLLTVIGKRWLDKSESGGRRIDDSQDYVRLETASALKRKIPVIPVLVQGAGMPAKDELPQDLKNLAFRNGVEISHTKWQSDVEVLISALGKHVGGAATNTITPLLSSARTGPSANPISATSSTSLFGRAHIWITGHPYWSIAIVLVVLTIIGAISENG